MFAVGFTVATAFGLSYGVGKSGDSASKETIYKVLKTVFCLEVTYYGALYFIKLSILLLYLRLSQTSC